MIRKIIKELNELSVKEQEKLIEIVNDVFFYWYKFETLRDAVTLVKSFNKPKPITYLSPLSEFKSLDQSISQNAFVVAFINTNSFFEKTNKYKDDRVLLRFLVDCKKQSNLLFRLHTSLLSKFGKSVIHTSASFETYINELIEELEVEIQKEYIKEIKIYRDKVLSHHTHFNDTEISSTVADSLIKAIRFLDVFLLEKVSMIITNEYTREEPKLEKDIKSLMKKVKPNLMDIIYGTVNFKTNSEEINKQIIADPLFQRLTELSNEHSITEYEDSLYVIYIIASSYYERDKNSPIEDKGQKKLINELILKYRIFGSQITETILDQ